MVKYCKNCRKELKKHQDIFCSNKCAKGYDWDLVGGDPSIEKNNENNRS